MNKLKVNEPELKNYSLGCYLKHLRWKNNLTQQELAELLDCSQSAVSMWERGAFIPYGKTREKIIQLYDLPHDFFTK